MRRGDGGAGLRRRPRRSCCCCCSGSSCWCPRRRRRRRFVLLEQPLDDLLHPVRESFVVVHARDDEVAVAADRGEVEVWDREALMSWIDFLLFGFRGYVFFPCSPSVDRSLSSCNAFLPPHLRVDQRLVDPDSGRSKPRRRRLDLELDSVALARELRELVAELVDHFFLTTKRKNEKNINLPFVVAFSLFFYKWSALQVFQFSASNDLHCCCCCCGCGGGG